jgi:hypothetical protein
MMVGEGLVRPDQVAAFAEPAPKKAWAGWPGL